jgi:NAD-dependent deacetylase
LQLRRQVFAFIGEKQYHVIADDSVGGVFPSRSFWTMVDQGGEPLTTSDYGSVERNLERLAQWLRQSGSTVVLTGAGMSTESGIPDFRSKDGWWRKIDPRTVATVEALENQYPLFRDFYQRRIGALRSLRPHRGHFVLASWEKRGWIRAIATQNVDGFHQQAGSKEVYELHGSLRVIRCHDCHAEGKEGDFLQGKTCRRCGGKLRPGVVLFGEILPESAWNSAVDAMRKADLVLVIGTSLHVYPVNQLPSMTQGRIVRIDAGPEESGDWFDLVVCGKAGEILARLDEMLTEEK